MCIKVFSAMLSSPLEGTSENTLIRSNFSSHKRDSILVAARSEHVLSAFPGPRSRNLLHCTKRKTPGFLILGSLEWACNLCYTMSSRTLEISGVRSYDRLPPLIDNQEQAITPASLGIVLNCWCLKFDCILFSNLPFLYRQHLCCLCVYYSVFRHPCQPLL